MENRAECPSHGFLIELANMRRRINVKEKVAFEKLLKEHNNTCEIDPKTHKIIQWLCIHNTKDTNINSLRFREEYQKHLYQNIE